MIGTTTNKVVDEWCQDGSSSDGLKQTYKAKLFGVADGTQGYDIRDASTGLVLYKFWKDVGVKRSVLVDTRQDKEVLTIINDWKQHFSFYRPNSEFSVRKS